jgi:hypothetical protein
MLFKFFAKEHYWAVEKELYQVFSSLGLNDSGLKIKMQPATYFKPYKLVTEGALNGQRFVLSLMSSELKKSQPSSQLEFIMHCENPAWLAFGLSCNESEGIFESKLDMQKIEVDCLNNMNISVACNQNKFVSELFKDDFCNSVSLIADSGFSEFQIERKRLYFKTDWLPSDSRKSTMLKNSICFSSSLLKKIDEWNPEVTSN